ncbi:MAG: response regulator [Planctomycetota bacterium]
MDERAQREGQPAGGLRASGLAHDLNNLLTALHLCGELMGTHLPAGLPVDAPLRADLVGLRLTTERLSTLVRRLGQLAAGQPEEGTPTDSCDLNLVIADFAHLLPRLLGPTQRCELQLRATPALVALERSRVEQVLLNLCLNARDAMPRGGRLLIETRRTLATPSSGGCAGGRLGTSSGAGSRSVELRVADEGGGMSPEVRARIFEPGFSTRRPAPGGAEESARGGAGLGLAIVHDLVSTVGGRVACESQLGQGSTFTVTLPAATEAAGRAPQQTPQQAPAPGSLSTILVVDDDPQVQQVVRGQLESNGYAVLLAADGEEALALLQKHACDAVLCDLLMPNKEGIETCADLRRLYPKLPVIAMTGALGGRDYLAAARKLGAVGSLVKPFSGQELVSEVRDALLLSGKR